MTTEPIISRSDLSYIRPLVKSLRDDEAISYLTEIFKESGGTRATAESMTNEMLSNMRIPREFVQKAADALLKMSQP